MSNSYKDILKKYSDMNKISDVPIDERRKDLAYLNKIANKNMKDLEKQGLTDWSYKMAKADLEKRGKEKFSTGKNATKREVNSSLLDVINFLESKTHNVSGYKKMLKQHEDFFKEHGLDLNKKGFDKEQFFEFLKSDEWRGTKDENGKRHGGLRKVLDSGQAFGVLMNVIANDNFTVKDLLSDFENYTNGSIKWNDIESKYGESDWIYDD